MAPRSRRRRRLAHGWAALGRLAVAATALLLCVACGGGGVATPAPTATAVLTSAPAVSPSPTPSQPPPASFPPAPSGHLAMPSRFEVELVPGRYWSAPPFEIGFSFEVDQPGWIAGHLNAEFFDIQRDADGAGPEWPQSILAFGLPVFIRGGTDIPATELTPAEAVAELQGRASLGASNVTELTLFGRPAVRVDLHAAVESPVFGAAGGTFTIGPQLDARFVLVPLGERLVAVIVQASPADLEARWLEALQILESVVLS
jgi:hypothetical protein